MVSTNLDPYATHQPVLFEVIKRTSGPILELGAGEHSTRQIHELAQGRKITTVDDDLEWLEKYLDLKSDSHNFILLSDFRSSEKWDVVFIDLHTWEQRLPAIYDYIDSDYVVIHDADYMFAANILSEAELKKLYKFTFEYFGAGTPTTLVCSNKFDFVL